MEKKRKYKKIISDMNMGLAFCTLKLVYKQITTILSERNSQSYSKTLHLLTLLCSAITCLRGSRSTYHHFGFKETAAIDLECAEGRINDSE